MNLSRVYFSGIESPLQWSATPGPRSSRNPEPRRHAGKTIARNTGWPPDCQNEPEVDPFLKWVLERARLDPAAYRPSALQRRLPACLRALRAPSAQVAFELLRRSPDLLPAAVHAMLIGVSDFFRDKAVFNFLHQTGLPALLRDRAGLRVLSAGCSDGQELYSVAMLLDQLGALSDSRLLGIDCRCRAVARAQSGYYDFAEVRGVPSGWRERYFRSEGGAFSVAPLLRDHAEWRVGNLLDGEHFERWDLILFRNVGIYMDPHRANGIWERLSRQLSPGGLLVTGKAERPAPHLALKRVFPAVYLSTACPP